MTKVFIAQQPQIRESGGYDITPALQYGEVIFVFDANARPSSSPDTARDHAYSKLELMEKGDYLIWAGGDPMALVLVAAIAADLTEGEFTWLRWDRQLDLEGKPVPGRGLYQPVPLNIFGD